MHQQLGALCCRAARGGDQPLQHGKVFLNTKIIRRVTFMVTSIVLSTAGHAVTLGDLRGSAVLGQALDVSAWIDAGDGEAISEACLSAQLLFGDVPQSHPKLHLQKPATNAATASWVRITSSAAVNEPVVTLVLSTTCGATTSRRYVLLSDFAQADLPTVNASPAAKSTGAASPSKKTTSPVETDLPPLAALPLTSADKASAPAHKVRPKSAKVAATAAPKKKLSPKLRLLNPVQPHAAGAEPDDGHLVLKLDSELLILNPDEMAAMAARRVTLPSLAPEGDALKSSAQIETLQNDLKTFKDIAAKNQIALAGLEIKLRQAEDERIPVIWLYVLGALLVAALAALAWVLRQQQNAKKSWWQQADASMMEAETMGPITHVEPSEPEPSEPAITPDSEMTPVARKATPISLDFDLDHLSNTAETDTVRLDMTSPSPFGATSDLHSEAISDLRQQAEFFVSLGQTSRAIDLLHLQIQDSAHPNPLVYLDLLTLYHSQGMKSDFRELRKQFNRQFRCQVPDFPCFKQEGKILLGYPELLAELVSSWSNGDAAAFLDDCIFRRDASALHVDFDLAAFRDLLLLRTLVKTTDDHASSTPARPSDVKSHQPAPANVPDLDVSHYTSNSASDFSAMPNTKPVTPSTWFTPPTVPTTEELDMEFPIDMFKTTPPEKS